jgi:L-fuconolactonase
MRTEARTSVARPSRVDAHVHFWRLGRGDYEALSPGHPILWRNMEPGELEPSLRKASVDAVIVVQAACTLDETIFILGLAEMFPWILGVVGWIDPVSPSIKEELTALSGNPKLRGVRPVRNDNISMAWMLDARADRCWRLLELNKLVLEILVQNPDELPLVAHLAKRYSGLSIILNHCGKPDIRKGRYQPWADDIDLVAQNRNVTCKFSGLLNVASSNCSSAQLKQFSDHVLAAFGIERILWASDWPTLLLAADYDRWNHVSTELLRKLTDAERNLVLGNNATRIYGVPSLFGKLGEQAAEKLDTSIAPKGSAPAPEEAS